MEPRWYLVKTKPLLEGHVRDRLAGAGYETLLPRFRRKMRRTGKTEVRPLFPTYLFVRFPMDQFQTIRYTRGVARVVAFGAEPQPVGEEIIGAVRGRMDADGLVVLTPKPPSWKAGDRVRIGEGPFTGFEAVFVEEIRDRDRVVLLLESVSGMKVTLGKDAIEE